MHTVEVRGMPRTATGKTGARQMRAAGRTPAVIYGMGEKSLAISLDSHEFDGVLRRQGSGAFVLDLKIGGQEERDLKAIIKELQRDPVTSRILHVDLLQISMTQTIHVKVPVHLTGTAIGVKEGGLLEHLCREIEVACPAAQIPQDIKVDISDLGKSHSLHVKDLPIPDGVTPITPEDRVVATIVVKMAAVEEVEAAADEAAAEEAGAAAEEGEGKKESEKTEEAQPEKGSRESSAKKK